MEQYVFYFLYNIEGATEKLYKFDTLFCNIKWEKGQGIWSIHSLQIAGISCYDKN